MSKSFDTMSNSIIFSELHFSVLSQIKVEYSHNINKVVPYLDIIIIHEYEILTTNFDYANELSNKDRILLYGV